MTISLELPAELHGELALEAARAGLALPEYLVRLVSAGRRPGLPRPGGVATNGADLVRLWREDGVVGSRPDISDPQSHSRRLRAQAERRARG